MAVTQPNLGITLSVLTGCSGLQLVDTTGTYNAITNPGGYGAPGGVAVNDVTTVKITLTYASMATTAAYVFTVSSGTITAATLSLGGATAVDIFSSITNTAWPFTSTNPFNLTGNYGVILPTFADDVFSCNYEIIGSNGGGNFDFITAYTLPVGCNLACCVSKKYQALDPTCSCCNSKRQEADYVNSLYLQFMYAAAANNVSDALAALREAQRFCGANSGGCGC